MVRAESKIANTLGKYLFWLCLPLFVNCDKAATRPTASSNAREQQDSARLSATRLLRRVQLTLLGKEPTVEEYSALRSAPSDQAREVIIQRAIDDALSSDRFYQQMMAYGNDYLQNSSYPNGTVAESSWTGGMGIELTPCPANSRHEGKLGIFRSVYLDRLPPDGDGIIRYGGLPIATYGDSIALCDTISPPTNDIVPWWAPRTTVTTIGRAGTGVRSSGGHDCGRGVSVFVDADGDNHAHTYSPDEGCSGGPNLIYCAIGTRYDAPPPFLENQPAEGRNTMAGGQRRSAYEEPARLFAHVVTHDRPFSDLVLGQYTVVNQKLQHMYVRLARMSSSNSALDDSQWWRDIAPEEWREVPFAAMHPNLLADRNYHFDPRRGGSPLGVPSAGVMTTLGKLGSFGRERINAARWLQIFACYSFTAPPAGDPAPPLGRDPATTGQCRHCHQAIDPAAVFFKRFGYEPDYGELKIGGIGDWRWPMYIYSQPFTRWNSSYLHGTTLTPASESEISQYPDARFIDFLPTQFSLLNRTSDGTNGPLGFGKILVESGEFDRCAVRQFYEHFVGRPIDLATERELHATLVAKFQDEQRNVRRFVRYLLGLDEFRKGL